MTEIIKRNEDSSFALQRSKLVSKQSSFKQRVDAAKAEVVDPNTMPNRICLLLDTSGSMGGAEGDRLRIDLLKDAVQNFVSRCNFVNTSVAMKTFPQHRDGETAKLSSNGSYIIAASMSLTAGGGTPLRGCVESTLEEVPLTRGVIVSDGGATDWHESHFEEDDEDNDEDSRNKILERYKELAIPLDCVHISSSSSGEDLLKRIAKATGGIFMKFTDVGAFSKAFGYLTPSYRAMLTSGSVRAAELGAREIK